MFVALGIQHVMYMRHIILRGQTGRAQFFLIISQTARKKLLNITCVKVTEHNMCESYLT